VGVKGWLLLLCVSMTIVGPLVALMAGLAVSTNKPFYAFTVFALIGYSLYVGILLWGRQPGAPHMAKIYLIINVGFHYWTAYTFSEVLSSMAMVETVVPGVIANGIWYAYLTKSKRVKATYGGSDSEDNTPSSASSSTSHVAASDSEIECPRCKRILFLEERKIARGWTACDWCGYRVTITPDGNQESQDQKE